MAKRYHIVWDDETISHIIERHNISEDEVTLVTEDEKMTIRRKGDRYFVTGRGHGGRLVSLVTEKQKSVLKLRNAWLAEAEDKSLYEGR